MAESGAGRIHLLNAKTNPTVISGVDTRFLSQVRPQDTIILPKNTGKFQVVRVLSDTELEVKKWMDTSAPQQINKIVSLLTKSEGTAYKCIPHVEQDSVYERVYDELNNGECITIFPEGGSHDRAEMLPFKGKDRISCLDFYPNVCGLTLFFNWVGGVWIAGVTIMALGAMAKYPGLDVKIVPCGLNYFHAHRFRSRAVIEFGNPITVPAALVEKFKNGGAEKREACGNLLDTIFYALKSVTVNASNDQTLMVRKRKRSGVMTITWGGPIILSLFFLHR
jgi:glycerol-3-phosphate O-acyltransferase/dihydroxyacetone phosphate acyltransferase